MPEYDSVKVKDQLGRPEDVGVFIKRKEETCTVEEGPTVISTVDVSSRTIWERDAWSSDSSYDWEGDAKPANVVTTVVNRNNIYREHFSNAFFEDTGSTTADWADTVGELDMTAAEIAQSNEIALNTGTITAAKITATLSAGVVGDLAFQLTANGGSNWENATHNTIHTFTNTGTDLRFKITASVEVKINQILV